MRAPIGSGSGVRALPHAQALPAGRLRWAATGRGVRLVLAAAMLWASALAAQAPAHQSDPFGELELYLAMTDELAPFADCLTRQLDDGGGTTDGRSLLRLQLGFPSPGFVKRSRRLLQAAGVLPYAGPAGQAAERTPRHVLADLRAFARREQEAETGIDVALLQTQAVALYLVELKRAAGGQCQPSPILIDAMARIEASY